MLEDKSGLQLAQAWKNRSVPHSAEPVVVSRASTRDVTVPIFGEHAERQVIPGTNTVVSHTAPNSQPTEVLSVPVYKQVGGPVSVQERADAAAARGLEKLAQGKQAAIDAGHLAERKAVDAAEATKRGAAEAKQYAQDKAQQARMPRSTPSTSQRGRLGTLSTLPSGELPTRRATRRTRSRRGGRPRSLLSGLPRGSLRRESRLPHELAGRSSPRPRRSRSERRRRTLCGTTDSRSTRSLSRTISRPSRSGRRLDTRSWYKQVLGCRYMISAV